MPIAPDWPVRRSVRWRWGRRSRGSGWGRPGRWAAAGLLSLVCLGGLGAGWVVLRGVEARDHLQHAVGLVRQLRSQVESGEVAAAATSLVALQQETRAARADADDPAWRLATRLPAGGDDLAAVRAITIAIDDLAHDGLPPLIELAGRIGLKALAPVHGRVNVGQLQAAGPRLAAVDRAVRRARDRVAAIALGTLLDRVRDPITKLRGDLDRAAAGTAMAVRAAAILPPMLGGAGARTYLVVFQNPAEARATGGLPGAYVVIRADRGRIEVIDQGTTATSLKVFDRPVRPLRPELRALYTDRMVRFPADVGFSPDFPTAAALFREMYRRCSGRTVDGVLATDPVALSYLLAALGPVPVPGGPALTARNAVRVLLSETYDRTNSPAEQDRYFASAALATFQAITGRRFDPVALAAQLDRAAGERRILLWSAHPAEQRALTGTVLAGALPENDGTRPTVGVFLNDGSGAKLGYYLRPAAALAVLAGCRADGRRKMTLRFSLRSSVPRSGLAPDVLGLGLAGDPYTVRTIVAIYSPTDGALVDMKLDGVAKHFGAGQDRRRAVGMVGIDLKPGATRVLDVTLLTGVPPNGWGPTTTPQLRTTPVVTPWSQSVRSADGCPNRR